MVCEKKREVVTHKSDDVDHFEHVRSDVSRMVVECRGAGLEAVEEAHEIAHKSNLVVVVTTSKAMHDPHGPGARTLG